MMKSQLVALVVSQLALANHILVQAGSEEGAPIFPTPEPIYSPEHQFISTVQLAIHESDPMIFQRSHRMAIDELSQAVSDRPELKHFRYEIRNNGNEVLLYMVTNHDVRGPLESMLSNFRQGVDGKMRAKGRMLYYRTNASESRERSLEVRVTDDKTKVKSIVAKAISLREVLEKLEIQLGGLNRLVPGECASRLVDWSFGTLKSDKPKEVHVVMNQLAQMFNLKSTMNEDGSYVFTGSCPTAPPLEAAADYLPTQFLPQLPERPPSERTTQVYFPLLPMD